jgi:GMP synthase (glutamine-hydrolysing)
VGTRASPAVPRDRLRGPGHPGDPFAGAAIVRGVKPSRPILIVQTGDPVPSVAARRGPFAKMIQDTIGELWQGDYRVADVRVSEPPITDGFAAIVITGSSANVPTREPWILRAEEWLRGVVETGVPTFGICFGHQILAQALGGEVIKNPRGREIGTKKITKRAHDPIFDGLPEELSANVTHLDTVGRLPAGATSLAFSPLEDHHAIKFTETCYGVQFHPEIDADVMRGYIEMRREILLSEGLDADRLHADVTDAETGAETLRNFVRMYLR